MNIRLRSGQGVKGSRQIGGHLQGTQPAVSQPAFSEIPPTRSGAVAHDAFVSPVHASSNLPKIQLPASVSVWSPTSEGIYSAPKSPPIPGYDAPHVVSGERYYSDKIPQQPSENMSSLPEYVNAPEGGASSGHPQKSIYATPSPSRSSSQGPKPIPQKSKKIPMKPHTDQTSPTSASEVKPKSVGECESDQLNDSTNQFENPLQQKLDEIQQHAADVFQEVSRVQQEGPENSNRPFDPNLTCPMCLIMFRIGETQFFKRHVNTCRGIDDEPERSDDWYILK